MCQMRRNFVWTVQCFSTVMRLLWKHTMMVRSYCGIWSVPNVSKLAGYYGTIDSPVLKISEFPLHHDVRLKEIITIKPT